MESIFFIPPSALALIGITTLTTIYFLSAKRVFKNF